MSKEWRHRLLLCNYSHGLAEMLSRRRNCSSFPIRIWEPVLLSVFLSSAFDAICNDNSSETTVHIWLMHSFKLLRHYRLAMLQIVLTLDENCPVHIILAFARMCDVSFCTYNVFFIMFIESTSILSVFRFFFIASLKIY